MTESEAIEKLRAYHKCQRLQVKGIYEDCNEKLCDNCDLCYAQGNTGEHLKSIEIAIQALETIKKLSDRKMTTEVLENYMQFEDECVEKGFTFKSVIEAREKQIPKKPIFNHNLSDTLSVFHCKCGNTIKVSHDIGIMNNNNAPNYCSKCGCRLDWSDND